MEYHKSLQPLLDFMQNLCFEEKHRKINYVQVIPGELEPIIYEAELYNSCNGLDKKEFSQKVKNITREIEDFQEESILTNGIGYKDEIRQVVKSLSRLKQDFFDDKCMYLGGIDQIVDVDIETMKEQGTFVEYLIKKYNLAYEEHLIDSREHSKRQDFFNILFRKISILEQNLSFLYKESNNITEVTTTKKPNRKKIKWNGTPGQLAFIFKSLYDGLYIELPGESFSKLAQIIDDSFVYEGKYSTLERNISKEFPISRGNASEFTIPPLDKISK